MSARNYIISHFLKICCNDNLPLNLRSRLTCIWRVFTYLAREVRGGGGGAGTYMLPLW